MFALAPVAGLGGRRKSALIVAFVAIVFAFVVGLRHEVGADWFSYLRMHDALTKQSVVEAWRSGTEPGFALVNVFSAQLGLGIYGVNLAAGAILMTGVAAFAFRQPNPGLVFVAATPVLVIVIGMGYTRQSAAVGFELLALNALADQKRNRFLAMIAAGMCFHKSVIVVLPIALFAARKKQRLQWLLIVLTGLVAAYFLLKDDLDQKWETYVVSTRYQSEGGLIRLAMNAVAASALLFLRKKLLTTDRERSLWTAYALVTVAALPSVFFASTVADRLGIYLIPVQLFFCGRLSLLKNSGGLQFLAMLAYGAVLFVWLHYANHAEYWVPYQVKPRLLI